MSFVHFQLPTKQRCFLALQAAIWQALNHYAYRDAVFLAERLYAEGVCNYQPDFFSILIWGLWASAPALCSSCSDNEV